MCLLLGSIPIAITAKPPVANNSIRIRSLSSESKLVPNSVNVPCTTKTLTALNSTPTPWIAPKMTLMKPSSVPLMMYNCGVSPDASCIAPRMVSGPMQNNSVAVTKPEMNGPGSWRFAKRLRITSPMPSSRSSIRSKEPITAPANNEKTTTFNGVNSLFN